MSQHSIIHVEIPAANREVSRKFYREVLGWDAKDMPNIPYPMFTAGDVTGGLPDVDARYKPDNVIIHISTDDMTTDLKNIVASGGSVVEGPYDLGPAGIVAFFTDPTGNRMVLFQQPQVGRIQPD